MARRKKLNRHTQHACRVCGELFDAVRDDAHYCSAKCRKRVNRSMHAKLAGIANHSALKDAGSVECGECGTARDGRATYCPVCQSTNRRPRVFQ